MPYKYLDIHGKINYKAKKLTTQKYCLKAIMGSYNWDCSRYGLKLDSKLLKYFGRGSRSIRRTFIVNENLVNDLVYYLRKRHPFEIVDDVFTW